MPTPTVIFALACDPPPPTGLKWVFSYQRGMFSYGNGLSIMALNVEEPYPKLVPANTGLSVPIPGIEPVFVTAILTIRPLWTAAVPIL